LQWSQVRLTISLTMLQIFTLALAIFPISHATAGDYTVSPLRLDFDRESKSGVVTLANMGRERLNFQVKAMVWAQDADGKDFYAETNELVFFPKILALEPNEERVIRVGIKAIPVDTERTFRLFIEKIPDPNPLPPPPGMNVSVNVRFALPVFVEPAVHKAKGEIVSAALTQGQLLLVLQNAGNEHFRIEGEGINLIGRNAQGAAVLTQTLAGRYLLAGTTKRYSATLPKQECVQLATLEVNVQTEQFTLSRKLDVNRTSCE
jgi:fimbrial chaperone protein